MNTSENARIVDCNFNANSKINEIINYLLLACSCTLHLYPTFT